MINNDNSIASDPDANASTHKEYDDNFIINDVKFI